MAARIASVTWVLVLMLWSAGCSTFTKQSAGDINSGLQLVVPASASAEWPRAKEGTTRLATAPRVVVAWAQFETRDGVETVHRTRATREGWISVIRQKIERSGLAASVAGTAPDYFHDGLTLAGVRQLATDSGADLVVVFTFDVRTRRYHNTQWGAVWTEVEVLTLAHGVGLTAEGVPVLSETREGFDLGTPERHSVEELEAAAARAAVDALADAIVERLRLVAPNGKGR